MTKTPKYIRRAANASAALMLSAAFVVVSALAAPAVYAQPTTGTGSSSSDTSATNNVCKAGQTGTPDKPCVPPATDLQNTPDPAAQACGGGDCSGIISNYINPFIKLLSALMGLVVVISIVVGGIQYASAGGDPSKVAAAKKRITNSIYALLAYLFLFAFLQWLIPGGIV